MRPPQALPPTTSADSANANHVRRGATSKSYLRSCVSKSDLNS